MITVVYCTRQNNPKHSEHIKKSSGIRNIEIIEIVNNGEALTKSYNRGLEMATNDIVIFMHDDIEFDTNSWGNKILKHFDDNQEFGILGLAGTTDISASGKWWEDRTKMVGIVNHKNEGKKWESKYSISLGNKLAEVLIVDGLFFCVHKKRIKEKFNENVDGFHFYEIDFVFRNYLAGVKVGVMFNVRVTHMSIGMTNEQWETNRQQFVNNFSNNLPQSFVPDFVRVSNPEDKNTKVAIKVVIQSSGDFKKTKKLIDDILSFNNENLKIALISNESSYNELKELNSENIMVYEGFYNSLPKNLSIVKYENEFINDNELVFLMNDGIEILNNIFFNFSKLYNTNKNTFGAGFPLSYNQNKTILSNSLNIFSNSENKIAVNLKDSNTYYNFNYGQISNPIGNLADCIVTTANNLKSLDFFKLNYETPIYFNDFSLRVYLRKKVVYIDTNSLTIQNSFSVNINLQEDIQNLINFIGRENKLQSLIKQIK